MLRSGATRPLTKSLFKSTNVHLRCQIRSSVRIAPVSKVQLPALVGYHPTSKALRRYAATHPGTPYDHIDKKGEEKVAKSELEHHPEIVSTDSSIHPVFHEVGVEDREKDIDMFAGVKADLVYPSSYRKLGNDF